MYLIVSGEVSVMEYPEGQTGPPAELGLIGAGECIGEMALFENVPQSASIQTTEESLFLVMHQWAFEGVVKKFPEIAISICKDLSARLHKLHEKIMPLENSIQSYKLDSKTLLHHKPYVNIGGPELLCRQKSQAYVDRAEKCLNPFPESSIKEQLISINQFVLERNS